MPTPPPLLLLWPPRETPQVPTTDTQGPLTLNREDAAKLRSEDTLEAATSHFSTLLHFCFVFLKLETGFFLLALTCLLPPLWVRPPN